MMYSYPFFGFPPFRRPYHYYPNYSLHNDMQNKNMRANSSSPSSFSANKKENFQENLHTPNFYNNNTMGHQFSNFSSFVQDSKINASNYSNNSKIKSSNDFQNFEVEQEECFEILGLKLHFDDLLLIALLFFLYKEDVKDSYLYVALILLLLS